VTDSACAVYVYYADRRSLSEQTVASLVTAEDRLRVTPTMHVRRRTEYLAGRALLRHALGAYTEKDAASFRIEVASNGKPECVGGPAISVSHSGDAIVCAVADRAIGDLGIDVEMGAVREVDLIAERFFTPAEARWVAAEPEPRFRRLWVLKEAYLKALGSGLAGGLSSLECRIEPPAVVAHAADGAAVPALALLAGQDCYVGIAALGGSSPVEPIVRRFAVGDGADALGPLRLIARSP